MNVTVTLSLHEDLVNKIQRLQKTWKMKKRSHAYRHILYEGLVKLTEDGRRKREKKG